MDSTNQPVLSKVPDEWEGRINSAQMFQLIDGILPFEACLYHQVLPLSIEGNRLNLGMVNPGDSSALDYVRRMMAYMNCSLVPQVILPDTHHEMLSAYLNHAAKRKAQGPPPQRPTQDLQRPAPDPKPVDRSAQPTFVIDSPDELSVLEDHRNDSRAVPPSPPPPPPIQSTPPSPPAQGFPQQRSQRQLADEWASVIRVARSRVEPTKETFVLDADVPPPPQVLPPIKALPVLEIEAHHLSSPVEVLATLSPNHLLQELLARVLIGGIGRLYFERQSHQGRILWSQNGVLQSVLEGLDLSVLQGVINELKRLTHLSLIPVQQPKQVEIERLYQQTRLLLRLRVMPGMYGEEATLQVLRGAALKFYQQQQLTKLGRDALGVAQQLQQKVNEIRDRMQANPTLSETPLEGLPALNQLVRYISQQLKDLESFKPEADESEPPSI